MSEQKKIKCENDNCEKEAAKHLRYAGRQLEGGVLRTVRYCHADFCSIHIDETKTKYPDARAYPLGQCTDAQCREHQPKYLD